MFNYTFLVVVVPGNGKITITGTTSNAIKEDVKNTVNYIKANEKTILDERHSLKETDLNIQVTNVLGNNTTAGIGAAIYVGILSALYKKNLKAGLAVIGNVTIGGAVERVVQFADKVSSLADNGAKMVIVPMDNISEIATIPTTVLSKCDVPFYNNAQVLLQKAMV
ncbi:MAG: S16 family serine protease [Lachnospiraceae bacterium]